MCPFKEKIKEPETHRTAYWQQMLGRLIKLGMSKETFSQLDVSNEDYLACYTIAIVHNHELANDVEQLKAFLVACLKLTNSNGELPQSNAIELIAALKAMNNGVVKLKTRVKKL